MVNNYGFSLLDYFENPDGALRLFEINIINYPESANAYDSLGVAYKETGAAELAIESFEKALEIDPDFENSKKNLEEMLQ